MTLRINIIIFLVLAALFSLLAYELWYHEPDKRESSLIGRSLPDFKLPNLLRPNEMLTAQNFQGDDIALLNIWATWCSSCRAEHEQLMAIKKTSGIPIYSVNYKDDPQTAKEWLITNGNPYRLTAMDRNGDLIIDLGVYGTPETFVLHHGKIVYRHIGVITPKEWRDTLYPFIKKLRRPS